MSKADEMFGALEYYKQKYLEHTNYYNEKIEKIISFRNNKTFASTGFYDGYAEITVQELQAINEKVKELGWKED